MAREPNKRPRRIPLTSEEVSNLIAHKKRRELIVIATFKKSRLFKALNIYIICCIFIYLELVFCYLGPSNYKSHNAINVIPYTGKIIKNGRAIISDLDIYESSTKVYKLIVDDFISVPEKTTSFLIGEDFLLHKNLKAVLQSSPNSYRLFSASPVLFLCLFASLVCFYSFLYNLNEGVYSLSGLAAVNTFTLLGIIMIG